MNETTSPMTNTQPSMELSHKEILEQIASAMNPIEPLNCFGDLVEEIEGIMNRHCPEIMNAAELATSLPLNQP